MIKVTEVKVLHIMETDPELNWIGEFKDNADPEDVKVIEHDLNNSRSYNYFVSCNAETKEQAQKDYDRMMSYENGNWYMIGIKVQVTISIPLGDSGSYILQTISSGGLWGIESDSDEKFLKETAEEQAEELKEILTALGIEWDGNIDEIEPTHAMR